MSVAMWNWHSWPLDISSSVNHLTVSNGLSLQTFISQSVICCKWQFQMGSIIGLFSMGSHYRHLSANQWSAVNDSFKWGDISQSRFVCQIWVPRCLGVVIKEVFSLCARPIREVTLEDEHCSVFADLMLCNWPSMKTRYRMKCNHIAHSGMR